MSSEIPDEWYFITAPQSVTWSKDSRNTVVDVYGTNNPYVHYGNTQLRKLNLNDAMVEGFSDGKVVEQNIIDLEACMRMTLDSGDGYAAPYCWNVYAGGKSYGTYIITSVNVTEEIRDTSGLAARAKVDVSFQEVAPYQVSSGIDISADALSGSLTPEAIDHLSQQAQQDQAAKDQNNSNSNNNSNNNNNNSNTNQNQNTGGGGGGGSDPPAYGGGYKDTVLGG